MTKYLVFVGCVGEKLIEVYFRDSMKLFCELPELQINSAVGADWTVLELENGKQIYLFTSVRVAGESQLVYFEFLIDVAYLDVPAKQFYYYGGRVPFEPPTDAKNMGDIKISGDGHFLFTHRQRFSQILGLIMCGYSTALPVRTKS